MALNLFGPLLSTCASPPYEQGSEGEQQASSDAGIIYSPFSCSVWEKMQLQHWHIIQPGGIKKRQPQPGFSCPESPQALSEDLAFGYFISDSLQSASSSLHASNQRRDNISLQARQLLLSSHMAFSQLSTALPSKQGSVRKFMY